MPSPYICKRYLLTRGCSWRKSLFLNFAENAKVAATGFERETRGDLSSLSNSSSRTKRDQPSYYIVSLCKFTPFRRPPTQIEPMAKFSQYKTISKNLVLSHGTVEKACH